MREQRDISEYVFYFSVKMCDNNLLFNNYFSIKKIIVPSLRVECIFFLIYFEPFFKDKLCKKYYNNRFTIGVTYLNNEDELVLVSRIRVSLLNQINQNIKKFG